jgi:hypothetical protein
VTRTPNINEKEHTAWETAKRIASEKDQERARRWKENVRIKKHAEVDMRRTLLSAK